MGYEFRLPKITGTTEAEQIAQIKSYLFQLTEQLEWMLNTIASSSSQSIITNSARTGSSSPAVASMSEETKVDSH